MIVGCGGGYTTNGIVIGALGQRLAGDIIESRDLGFAVRDVVYPPGRRVNISVGNTSKDDFIWHVQIDNQSQWG